MVSRILKTCSTYSSGVTPAILLSDLFQAWNEQRRYSMSRTRAGTVVSLTSSHRRRRLPDTVTIDSVYEKNFLSSSSVLEAVIVDAFTLPGTNIYMLKLGDLWSSCTIDMYLHRRYYHLVDPNNGIMKKGRAVFLTGCCLRPALEGSGQPRILPTEYLVIILDEDQDEDVLFLDAQFCSDSFSSISARGVHDGTSFSFYARIESVGPLEVQGASGSLQRKEIMLVDKDGAKMSFLLWGDQVHLANLFSVGSNLALDRPFIGDASGSSILTDQALCLEYGSATQLYVVPCVQHEEQVLLTSTQLKYQGSKLPSPLSQDRGLNMSQVSLPLDAQGSINLSNYPYQYYITDLRDKMNGISIYGVVSSIDREKNSEETVFSLSLKDTSGEATVNLHFVSSWSLGRLGVGHVVFISGLTTSISRKKTLELSWFQKNPGASFSNLSYLPAVMNSQCLHNLSRLSDIFNQGSPMHVCSVQLDHLENHHIQSMLSHSVCGYPVYDGEDGLSICSFCHCSCNGELTRNFYLNIMIADESTKVSAWCIGQTAAELLQISPDEFYDLPEDEQAMYLFTLGSDKFMIILVKSKRETMGSFAALDEENVPNWEITRAQKCD